MIVDLVALQIFKTVAEEGGITRAANRMHRVQSNITTRVRQLEGQLGTQLFVRHKRKLALTAEGEVLLDYATRMLQLAEEAQQAVRVEAPRGRLTIGALESTAATRLPALLARYHRAYPQVRVELATGTSGALVHKVASGEIEAAFVVDPPLREVFDSTPAFKEELVIIAPPRAGKIKNPGDLRAHSVIAFGVGCAYRKRFHDWLAKSEVRPARVMEFQSYHAIVACVAAGAGVAIVPRSVLSVVSARAQVTTYPLPARVASAVTQLVWRKGYRSAALAALCGEIASNGQRRRGR
jgi:DNA-binding transcriptional LysR family regulator